MLNRIFGRLVIPILITLATLATLVALVDLVALQVSLDASTHNHTSLSVPPVSLGPPRPPLLSFSLSSVDSTLYMYVICDMYVMRDRLLAIRAGHTAASIQGSQSPRLGGQNQTRSLPEAVVEV